MKTAVCCLKTITRALNRRLLRANGDRELGILRTLDAVADRQQTPGDGEERVHGFASAQARRGVFKESRLLVRVTGRRVNAVHIPRTSGGFDVREVKVHGFVAVLRLDGDRAAKRESKNNGTYEVSRFVHVHSNGTPHHHHPNASMHRFTHTHTNHGFWVYETKPSKPPARGLRPPYLFFGSREPRARDPFIRPSRRAPESANGTTHGDEKDRYPSITITPVRASGRRRRTFDRSIRSAFERDAFRDTLLRFPRIVIRQ